MFDMPLPPPPRAGLGATFKRLIRNIIAPSNATPGQARLLIGPDLPPPLNSYSPSAQFGVGSTYAGAIIWYSQGDDTSYIYAAVVSKAGIPSIAGVVFGHVTNGSLMEMNGAGSGDPMGVIWRADTGGSAKVNMNADTSRLVASGNLDLASLFGSIIHTAAVAIQLTANGGNIDIVNNLATGDINVTSKRRINLNTTGTQQINLEYHSAIQLAISSIGVETVGPLVIEQGATDQNSIRILKGAQGSVNAGPAAAASFTSNVVFNNPFPIGVVPHCTANINAGAAAQQGWVTRCINVNNAGFTIFGFQVNGIAGTWNAQITWDATVEAS